MKQIYMIRHGQTLFNKQSKIQGFCDSPLTELGIKQAKIARKHLDDLGIQFDEAYSSTSERAIDTLQIITDIPFKTDKNLREWNFGDLEGEGEHLNPPLPYRDFFVQFGGEDEFAFQKRIVETIVNIVKTSSAKHILIVSHGAAMAQFYRYWEKYSQTKRMGRIQNCSIFRYTFDDDVFSLKEIIEHDFSMIEQ